MGIKYTNIIDYKALENLPKLRVLVLKYIIRQPWTKHKLMSVLLDHTKLCPLQIKANQDSKKLPEPRLPSLPS
jgi:hypothetical protein